GGGENVGKGPEPFGSYLWVKLGHAGQVAAGSGKACDEPNLDRVDPYPEDDRNGRSRRLGRHCRSSAAGRHNHGHLTVNQFGRKHRQSIILAFRPAIFDLDVLAFDISCLFQSLAERTQADRVSGQVRRCAAEEPDHRHRRLLRARRERPRGSAAEQRDELAARHSITSSARVRSMGGTARPMAFAAFKLITSSSCVGNSIGSSAGVAPLKILSMYTATRRAFARRLMP